MIRSGAGAHFKTHVYNNLGWEMMSTHLDPDTQIYLADNRSEIPVPNTQSQSYSDAMTNILTRDNDDDFVEEGEESGYEDSDVEEDEEEEEDVAGQEGQVDDSFYNINHVGAYKHAPVPVSSVFDVKYSARNNTAIVIGGETEGLSVAARKLCFDRHGGIVNLPMAAGSESLNAGIAAAVILYEVKRQLIAERMQQQQRRARKLQRKSTL